ncbi:MAG: hypothetical protein U0807_13520 [Candidatus Binatia bacterium]
MRTRRIGRLATVAAAVAILSLPQVRAAAAEESSIEKRIETARTAADHEAIAGYYEREAKEAHAKAAEHRKMGVEYKKAGGAFAAKTHFHEHCEALVRSYESLAKENEALAAAHHEMAKSVK